MNTPQERIRRYARTTSPIRRIAATLIVGAILFVVLWLMAFSLVMSLLVASGCCIVLVAAGTASDLVEIVLDAIAAVVFGVLAVIAAVFAAIFAIFGF